jgi:hypothetical protein
VLPGKDFLTDAPIQEHELLIHGNSCPDLGSLNAFFDAGEQCRIRLIAGGLICHRAPSLIPDGVGLFG